jgi:hypothetical protein
MARMKHLNKITLLLVLLTMALLAGCGESKGPKAKNEVVAWLHLNYAD